MYFFVLLGKKGKFLYFSRIFWEFGHCTDFILQEDLSQRSETGEYSALFRGRQESPRQDHRYGSEQVAG